MNSKQPSSSAPVDAVVRPSGCGWAWPDNSRKAHYFVEGISLCRKMLFLGITDPGNNDSPDNCAKCQRERKKMESA